MVDTWDIAGNKLLPAFTPHPNSFYLVGLLTRFMAKHSSVLASSVEGGVDPIGPQVFAAALRSPRGQYTLIVANDAEADWDAEIDLQGIAAGMTLYRYRMSPEKKNRVEVVLGPQDEYLVSAQRTRVQDRLPARSLTVYSTYHLPPGDPGIMAE